MALLSSVYTYCKAAKLLLFCDIYNRLQQENATNFRLFAIKMCDFWM